MSTKPHHILIVNQHGDNRGDEAALLAMLGAFSDRLRSVRFSLVHQFKDPNLPVDYGPHDVTAMSMVLPFTAYLRLASYTGLQALGIKLHLLANGCLRPIIDAYESADLVVSAPGGPYFGDIYRDHELAHWLFVLLGRVHRRPTFLYATSAGPFNTAVLNAVRRRGYSWFDDLCVRENRSAAHLRELCAIDVEVTADSALQRTVEATSRASYFAADRAPLGSKFLVALTALQHRFADDGAEHQQRYEEALIAAVQHVANRRDCHFLLLPQLYGAAKSDVSYLEEIGLRLGKSVSWELVDPRMTSDGHRGLVAMCELSIACRYHPQIFASVGATPGVCIYYEHKAQSHMESMGLGRFAFDIHAVDGEAVIAALDQAIDQRDELTAHMQHVIVAIRQLALRTTEKAAALVERSHP